MSQKSQNQVTSKSTLQWALTALAVIGLLYALVTIRSKNARIAELESIEQGNTEKIAKLDQNVETLKEEKIAVLALADKTGQLNGTLLADNGQIPGLKKDLSFARAANTRLQHIGDARNNLMAQIQANEEQNTAMSQQVARLPDLKKELSFANASNMRLLHVSNARDNLMSQLRDTQAQVTNSASELSAQSLQLAAIPNLKTKLSHARADIKRLQHISAARDNLVRQLHDSDADIAACQQAQATLMQQAAKEKAMAEQPNPTTELAEAPILSLKKQLSYANAANKRLEHVQDARANLMTQLQDANSAIDTLSTKVSTMESLKKELSLGNAANARLTHISQARDRLQQQLRELSARN